MFWSFYSKITNPGYSMSQCGITAVARCATVYRTALHDCLKASWIGDTAHLLCASPVGER